MDGSSQMQPEKKHEDLPPELAARREAALASLRVRQTRREAAGYAVMAGAMSAGSAFEDTRGMGRVVHYARLFLIAFAMLAPNYLIWRLLL
ncbi:MAG: hypothetical protein HLUCCA24_02715 [Rhodobacteraceae bacterium HLUCCA24]|nr:MAG: hypothetical protein HLUCCA24_02715 [Rhodobacteraceae bacterium HLUCCA24]